MLVVVLGSICWGVVFGSLAAVIWRLAGATELLARILFGLIIFGVIGYALTPDRPAWMSPGVYIREHSSTTGAAVLLLVVLFLSAVAAFLLIQRISPKPGRQ